MSGTSKPLDELQKMGYTVAWGMRMPDVTIGISNFVLAYPADGLQNGGMVLMLDGAALPMSAEELQTALQNQASIRPAAAAGGSATGAPPAGPAGAAGTNP
jgi:hypothetical protein